MPDFEYEITEELGVLGQSGSNTKEINLVSYGKRDPVVDIRAWYETEDGEKRMSKGITLKFEEAAKLREILNDMDLD